MIRTDLIVSIGELLARRAEQRPDATAFKDKARAVTYSRLAERTGQIAIYLQKIGVKVGRRVAIYLPNSVDWVEACIGSVRTGAVAVPISVDATMDEIMYRLSDADCEVIFCRSEHISRLKDLTRENKIRLIAIDDGDSEVFDPVFVVNVAPRDPADLAQPAFIVYTSGTTGRAKGVLLSLQGMLWVTAACWSVAAGLSEDDYLLSSLPLYHSYALNLSVVSVIATGAQAYLMDHFSASKMASLLDEEEFTILPGVPTIFQYLLEKARESDRRTLGSVRLCISAGAILPGTFNRQFEERFGVTLLDGYGITETSTMVTVNWPSGGRTMGSCGLPLPGLLARVVDANDVDVDVNAEGELIVRGPNVMLGYHGKPEETASALRSGWYRTGDLARRDKFGYLYITGRLKEIIIRGGQNIAPAEVEEVLAGFQGVLDCAVVGIAHEFLGEVPVAFIVARPDHAIEPATIIEYCQTRLSTYKIPQAVHLVDAIPRTGSGKVQRFKLKQHLDGSPRP